MENINRRKVSTCVLLSLITFGGYLYYWKGLLLKNTRIIKNYRNNMVREYLCVIFVPFYSWFWWYRNGKFLSEEFKNRGVYDKNLSFKYLIFAVFGLGIVSASLMQNDFNQLTYLASEPAPLRSVKIDCKSCGAEIVVNTYRKFVVCPYCGEKFDFDGFEYETIDWNMSKYAYVNMWMDCPSCLSPNMYLGSSKQFWECPDCGYKLSDIERKKGCFWHCDNCETFMNVQKGFNTKTGRWKCSECGYDNDVTETNMI